MRVGLFYAAEPVEPEELRSALGIAEALRAGGHAPFLFSATPVSLPACETVLYDPAAIAPWTSAWQRHWRLPTGLALALEREPQDLLLCCGDPGDVPIARLAAGYASGPPILTWFLAMPQAQAPFAQYADLHLAPSIGHARVLGSLPAPARPIALAARPVPVLPRVRPSSNGRRLLFAGPSDGAGGLGLLLSALALLPADWSLGAIGKTLPDARAKELAAAAGRGRVRFLEPSRDPWSSAPPADLCVVTQDGLEETRAIAEAVARGIPVAATTGVTGARDLVEGDEPVPAEPSALAAALRALRPTLGDVARRQAQRAEAARRDAPTLIARALRYLPPRSKVVRVE